MLTFGVVICTYNRRDLLEICLKYWCQSERLPDQFIVVDATQNARQYREALIQKFPKLFSHPNSQYIVVDHPGLTRQRNIGLEAVKTDIVCFADDDTFVHKNYVTKTLEVFQADSLKSIGGVNGTATGQFDNWKQKNLRLVKNFVRHHYGWMLQRIHIPKSATKLYDPLPSGLEQFPLIPIDRLWGANMNYRTELISSQRFDENFRRYGLFEDVDVSMRVGKTHKLVCRLDAEVIHDDVLGQTTRPNDAKYFLASWLNSAYLIEKLFPCRESRSSHRRLFQLTSLISQMSPKGYREKRFRSLGNEKLRQMAVQYIDAIQNCVDRVSLEATFVKLQREIEALDMASEDLFVSL